MKRKKIAAANWKMNTTVAEGVALFEALNQQELDKTVETVICAPATHLSALTSVDSESHVHVGGQNMYFEEKGAYTGEISASMLLALGVSHVIIGHSERREYFNETNDLLAKKLAAALNKGLTPIFCCGERLGIRKSGGHVDYVVNQLQESLGGCTKEDIGKIVIAYEPIWAIGTGETASPEQAQEMHAAIRSYFQLTYGDVAAQVPILYGGSVKPNNAKEIFGQADVDGGLVGGASLKVDSFSAIINSF